MLSFISRQVMKKRFREFNLSQKNLMLSQEKALNFLKAHNPYEVKARNYKEFIKEAPIQNYDDITIFKKMIQNPKKYNIHYFALTSGTTGPCKKIPYNKGIGHIAKKSQTTAGAIFHNKTGINPITMKTVVWGGSQNLEPQVQGIDCGSSSGYASLITPKLLQRKRYPSVETQNITDFDLKIQKLLQECKNVDIDVVGTLPSYFEYIMQSIIKHKNIKTISEFWPNLQLFIYSGTAITQYKDRLFELIGKEIETFGLYNSTESPMGLEAHMIQEDLPGYLLNAEDVIYGFAYDDGNVATIDEVKEGDEARILVSMPNGFHNYAVGDRVRITSLKPYFTLDPIGREGTRMDTYGEKILESDLQLAVKIASRNMGFSPEHFFVYPGQSEEQKKCYQWVIVHGSELCQKTFNTAIDKSLMEVSDAYRMFRKDMGVLSLPQSRLISNELTRKIFEEKSHKCQLKLKTIFPSKIELESYLGMN